MASDPPGLDKLVKELGAALGAEHVITDPRELERASTATFATRARVLAIARAGSTEEVRECLRLCSRASIAVYPVSGGKNWGLGSRVPPSDAVLLDLGRMNRIVHFDEELATVTLEPGVSFARLYAFLCERRSRLFASTTGGSPDGSVVANALERGDGSGPHGERALHLTALEVVLATGEVLHTGFDRFEGCSTAELHRFGVGPALDGLFVQSNLGVVTRATVWLAPLPRFLAAVRFGVPSDAELPALVDAVRRLRLDGTLRAPVGIWNDYRVLSVAERYPFERSAGVTPLPREVLAEKSAAWGGQRWLGLASVYAPTRRLGEAAVDHVEATLRPCVETLVVEARSGEPSAGNELFPTTDPGFAFLQGVPHQQSLRSMYWRKPGAAPAQIDPDRDRVGVLWVCLALPLAGARVAQAVQHVERCMLAHGFEPLLALVVHGERVAQLLPMIVYDRDEAAADARALACHDALLGELGRWGHLPQRLALPAQDALPPARDDHASVLGRIKTALDPAAVLAPGRYDFRRTPLK